MESHFNKVQYGWLALLLLFIYSPGVSQNYYGIQGSSYAGSLSIGNNPAAMVNTPYAWDIDILSFQAKNATNAVTVYNYSLLSNPQQSQYVFNAGDYRRHAYADFNVNILNSRFAINRRQAIGFGINLRGYAQVHTASYNFIDSLKSTRDFFDLGNYNRRLYGDLFNSSWVELFVSYGQTIWDRIDTRLNAGITLKVSRGISGAYAYLQNGQVVPDMHNNNRGYVLQDAMAEYGYSANYDDWKDEKSTRQNLRDFVSNTRGGFSFDLGVEYIIKPQVISTIFDDDAYYDYDWKIGISVLDIGFNQYKYGKESRSLSGFEDDVTDTVVDQRFSNIRNLEEFNNNLPGIVQNIQQPIGVFRVVNPTRLVINADRYLFDAFYINGNLSVNLSPLSSNRLRVAELNLLTITPRWETRTWGIYLPLQLNTKEKIWVGGAFKIGPLLIGIHHWGNLLSKKKMQNGGGYLALVIHPWKNNTGTRLDKRLNCPPR